MDLEEGQSKVGNSQHTGEIIEKGYIEVREGQCKGRRRTVCRTWKGSVAIIEVVYKGYGGQYRRQRKAL